MSQVEIRAEIERGRESLAAARHLAEGGFFLDSTSRSYYAVLHFTRAILLSHQQVPKSISSMPVLLMWRTARF